MVDQQIDIITVTYGNMFSVIKRTIDSLHKFTEEPFRVIIVNNGSTDETMTSFNNLSNCILINLENNIGLVKGFNIGLKQSTAPFIARMDHDIEFIMPWKKRFLKLLEENQDVGVIGPRIVLANNKIYFALFSFFFKIPRLPIKFRVNNPLSFPRFSRQFILWEYNNKKEDINGKFNVVKEISHATGTFYLMKREVFEKVGFADELYLAKNGIFEDLDYSLRIETNGYKTLFDGTIKIIHHCERPYKHTDKIKDLSSLYQQQRQLNRKRLKEKWGL